MNSSTPTPATTPTRTIIHAETRSTIANGLRDRSFRGRTPPPGGRSGSDATLAGDRSTPTTPGQVGDASRLPGGERDRELRPVPAHSEHAARARWLDRDGELLDGRGEHGGRERKAHDILCRLEIGRAHV